MMSQTTDKMQSLIEDFNKFSQTFSKPKRLRRKRKPKVTVVPTVLRQDSNISEDSNDPKRRKNVLGSIDQQFMNKFRMQNPLPLLGQSINEEPFLSEDLSSESGQGESEDRVKNEESKQEIIPQKAKTNAFFIHK